MKSIGFSSPRRPEPVAVRLSLASQTNVRDRVSSDQFGHKTNEVPIAELVALLPPGIVDLTLKYWFKRLPPTVLG